MKTMKWLLGVVIAAAVVAPLQSANAWGGGPYGGVDTYETHRVHYRGGDYDGGYRGNYRGHWGYYGPPSYYRHHRHYGPPSYYRGHRHYYGGPGYYGRPRFGYRGSIVVVPPLLPPPPLPPW